MTEDIFDALNNPCAGGVEVTLQKDTQTFKKVGGPNSRGLYRDGVLQKGEIIEVGKSEDVVTFEYDHRPQEFIPWLDDPEIEGQEDEMKVRYIRVEDLPPDW